MENLTDNRRIRFKKKVAAHITRKVSKHRHRIHKSVHVMSSFVLSIEYIILFVGSILSILSLSSFANLGGVLNETLQYPLQQVSIIECRTTHWSELEENCIIDLPIIADAAYSTYHGKELYRQIYTVLWGAPYKGDSWDMDAGAHLGVDIATSEGTPLYSVAEGEVVFAGFQNGYGNVVKIRFTRHGRIYYAITAHMEKIMVHKGETVYAGQQIGTVGNTGSVFGALGGYHVHFEITEDNYGRPKYGFLGCKDLSQGHMEIINNGLCREELHAYTHDPILFLESSRQHLAPPKQNNTPDVASDTTNDDINNKDNTDDKLILGEEIIVKEVGEGGRDGENKDNSQNAKNDKQDDAENNSGPIEIVITEPIDSTDATQRDEDVSHEIGKVVTSNHSDFFADVTLSDDIHIVEFLSIPGYDLSFDTKLFLDQYQVFATYEYTSARTVEYVMSIINKTTGKPFHGILPMSLQFISNDQDTTITRETVSLVHNGKITNTFTLSGKKDTSVAILLDLERWSVIDL